MVYNNNLIAVIKCKGKVLREFESNVVRLPFGSDYSIYIKNKDAMRKAVIKIKVDGKDVLDGNSLMVEPGNTTELKGFMKGLVVKNKFRFIEKTNEISKYRGNFIEDGLVEIEYQFEEYLKNQCVTWTTLPNSKYGTPSEFSVRYFNSDYSTTSLVDNVKYTKSKSNDCGITVPGAETLQPFNVCYVGDLENIKYNIIINLKGTILKNKKALVREPVTVKTKLRCPTCGRRWTSNLKYCGNCSTYLH